MEPAELPVAAGRSRRTILRVLLAASLGAAGLRREALAEIARPAFDPALMERVLRRAADLEQLNGLIVGRHGTLAIRRAFRGPPLDRPVNVKSVSKTIVASLVGAALDRGFIPGVDAPLGRVAPSLIPADADPRVRDITLAHLLTMQAGLERTSGPNYGRWVQSRDWVAHVLNRPFVAEPGDGMLYSTGSYHVLGAALSRATDRSLLALARDWLGEPLDIAFPPWTRDPQGFYMGGNNMAMSPLDLFRFGEMWRARGVRNGTRVLSEAWIEASWTPRTRSVFSGDAYGYGWFLARAGGHDIAYARGYGGQMLYVVPSLGVTVVVTSDDDRPARSHGYAGELKSMLVDDIIPAAERA